MFSAMTMNPTPISRDYNKKLVKIIQTLLAYEQSNIFRKPIPHKSLGWEDYKDIVKKPIDLNFVRRQYNEGKYKSVEQVLDEIQLIWDNVFVYGKRDHQTFDMAVRMQKYFDDLLNDLMPEYHEKINRVLYFKQFQNNKPQKKSSSLINTDKNSKRLEKMEVQHIKEQVKIENQPQVNLQSKKKQSMNSRRQSNTVQQQSLPILKEQNNSSQKRNAESVNKVVESKKSANNNASNAIVTQQPIQPNSNVEVNQPVKNTQGPTPLIKQSQTNETKVVMPTSQPSITLQTQPSNAQQTPPQGPQAQPIQPENEDSQQNQFPPIMVSLNKNPTLEQISQISDIMKLLFEVQQFETLSKIVKILTKYEKQNMIIDGEDVNFRMNQIHISTYQRIRKELQIKLYQLEQSEKIKDINLLKAKYNIKSLQQTHSNFIQNNQIEIIQTQKQQN